MQRRKALAAPLCAADGRAAAARAGAGGLCAPSADDFIYAARTHAVVQQYGLDLPRLLRAAWDTNVYYYENWQGLYVSGFTLAFQPAIFGNRYYGATLVCVLLPLFFCLYGLARCVVLRLDRRKSVYPGHWRCC